MANSTITGLGQDSNNPNLTRGDLVAVDRGSLTLKAAIDGSLLLPVHSTGNSGDFLSVDSNGRARWSDAPSVSLSANDVLATHIQAGAVTAAKLNAGSAIAGRILKLTSSTVMEWSDPADLLGDGSVTSSKIANSQVLLSHLHLQTGTRAAGKLIGIVSYGGILQLGSVDAPTPPPADGSITNAKVASNAAIAQSKLADLTTSDLPDNIPASKLASGVIPTIPTELPPTDLSVATGKIANLAVSTAKIAADAVTQAKIGDDAVGVEQLKLEGSSSAGDVLTRTANGMAFQAAGGSSVIASDRSLIHRETPPTDKAVSASQLARDLEDVRRQFSAMWDAWSRQPQPPVGHDTTTGLVDGNSLSGIGIENSAAAWASTDGTAGALRIYGANVTGLSSYGNRTMTLVYKVGNSSQLAVSCDSAGNQRGEIYDGTSWAPPGPDHALLYRDPLGVPEDGAFHLVNLTSLGGDVGGSPWPSGAPSGLKFGLVKRTRRDLEIVSPLSTATDAHYIYRSTRIFASTLTELWNAYDDSVYNNSSSTRYQHGLYENEQLQTLKSGLKFNDYDQIICVMRLNSQNTTAYFYVAPPIEVQIYARGVASINAAAVRGSFTPGYEFPIPRGPSTLALRIKSDTTFDTVNMTGAAHQAYSLFAIMGRRQFP